ncbi:MAG TPA: type II toxin-antitoxin system PemK/MazF family toxin [Coleofasciculaceae cyanobacterium]
MATSYPRQGEVYLIKALKTLGDTKKRPAVVISMNVRNEFRENVLIVPFTSDLTSGETPTRILMTAGEGGLESASLALCDNISAVRKLYLERGPYGAITPQSLAKIQRAI